MQTETIVSKTVAESINSIREDALNMAMENELDLANKIHDRYKLDKNDILFGYCNGPETTRHGVNAEHITVAEFNYNEARQAFIEGREPVFMEKSSDVNGPHDMIRVFSDTKSELFQAKYCKTTNSSLNHCIEHIKKYPDMYANNPDAYYVIPKDQFQILMDIKNGKVPEGMKEHVAENLRKKIEIYEELKGASLEESMQGGAVTYSDSYQDNNQKTIKKQSKDIKKEHKKEKETIVEEYKPKLVECVKAALSAAGIGAALSSVFHIYNQYTEGKNIFTGDYTEEDYKELGLQAARSAGVAGVSSAVLYWVNAVAKSHAKCIVAFGEICKVLHPIRTAYINKEITFGEFMGAAYATSSTIILTALGDSGMSAIVAVAIEMIATAGFTMSAIGGIVLGIVGSIISTMVTTKIIDMADNFLNADIQALMAERNQFINDLAVKLELDYQEIEKEYKIAAKHAKRAGDLRFSPEERLKAMAKMSNQYDGYQVNTKLDPKATLASLLS